MFEASLKVLKKIESHGYKAYIVGGFVRDYILGIELMDVDISTNATPKELLEIFKDSALPNEEYGAVTLYYKNNRYEITTFRREIRYINNRKPIEIEYIDDLVEDLKRRDFRMNTLCIDAKGEIIDLLGGKEDIDNHIINTVGSSDFKFEQDSLRILRAIRFATILNFELSKEVKESIKKYSSSLRSLSYSRKKQELDKIFASTNSQYGVSLLINLGLDEDLELYGLDKVVLNSDLLGVWASIGFSNGYTFTANERELISKIKDVVNTKIDSYTLYKYGLYVNQEAANILGIDKSSITSLYESLPIYNRKDIDITSEDILKSINKKPGPILREIYVDITNKILKGDIENKKDNILNYIVNNYS
jgi:tRNA nucleotidyltransferase (CCA-adding enzyme)